jgi:HAD superfamily hydrolase (TIGR01549 family)
MSYDGLLLDHDGVLVGLLELDSVLAGLRRRGGPCFRELGIDPASASLDALGVGADPAEVRTLADRHGVDARALWRCRDEAVEEILHAATRAGKKDPYDDVDALRSLDVPRGVVSNNQRRIVEFVLGEHGLRDLFGTVQARAPTLDSLDQKKPAPTYLDAAAADLGIEHPLYVGDSESDVLAARRAGLDVAFLRRPHNAGRSLPTEPTYEVDSLHEIAALCRSD